LIILRWTLLLVCILWVLRIVVVVLLRSHRDRIFFALIILLRRNRIGLCREREENMYFWLLTLSITIVYLYPEFSVRSEEEREGEYVDKKWKKEKEKSGKQDRER